MEDVNILMFESFHKLSYTIWKQKCLSFHLLFIHSDTKDNKDMNLLHIKPLKMSLQIKVNKNQGALNRKRCRRLTSLGNNSAQLWHILDRWVRHMKRLTWQILKQLSSHLLRNTAIRFWICWYIPHKINVLTLWRSQVRNVLLSILIRSGKPGKLISYC